jgi:hypothetical protein
MNKIESLLSISRNLKGLIDPRYSIESVIDVKWFKVHETGPGGYSRNGFGFQLSKELLDKMSQGNSYEITLHLFEYVTIDKVIDELPLKPQNWGDEVVPSVNSTKIVKPKPTKALIKKQKGIPKGKFVSSAPVRLQLTSKQMGNQRSSLVSADPEAPQYCLNESSNQWNRFEVAVPKHARFDSVVVFAFSTVKTSADLVKEVEKRHSEAKQHSLDIGDDQPAKSSSSILSMLSSVKSEQQSQTMEDDDMMVSTEEVIPLTDPLTMSRISIAAKGNYCVHKRCFDLSTYIDLCMRSRVWQCPACDRRCPYDELVIDDLVNEILTNPTTRDVAKVKVDTQTGKWEILEKKEATTILSTTITAAVTTPAKNSSSSISSPVTPSKLTSSLLAEIIIDDLSDDDPSKTDDMPPLFNQNAILARIFNSKSKSVQKKTPAKTTVPALNATGGQTLDDAIEID